MAKEKEETTEKLYCRICKTKTNHKILWKEDKRHWGDYKDIWVDTSYDLLSCRGCDEITLRKIELCSENIEMVSRNRAEIVPEITLWPKRSERMLSAKNYYNAPWIVKRLYREVIEAFNSELQTLCAAGIRAVIEVVCKEEGISGKDLKEKIEKLREKSIIGKSLEEGLHQSRLLGNEALHEMALFGDEELKIGIEFIESLIYSHYEALDKINLLKDKLKKKQ